MIQTRIVTKNIHYFNVNNCDKDKKGKQIKLKRKERKKKEKKKVRDL